MVYVGTAALGCPPGKARPLANHHSGTGTKSDDSLLFHRTEDAEVTAQGIGDCYVGTAALGCPPGVARNLRQMFLCIPRCRYLKETKQHP
jgi:hypothetical protein